uniref:(northern house mosquito) hypothetical protein n=1 Tax=Culex pipiens TaxID=7175 RepID=A0A8D8PIL4_CULPI
MQSVLQVQTITCTTIYGRSACSASHGLSSVLQDWNRLFWTSLRATRTEAYSSEGIRLFIHLSMHKSSSFGTCVGFIYRSVPASAAEVHRSPWQTRRDLV